MSPKTAFLAATTLVAAALHIAAASAQSLIAIDGSSTVFPPTEAVAEEFLQALARWHETGLDLSHLVTKADPTDVRTELAELRARVAALETENAELLVEQTKLATERDILRQAATYFAGETIW